MAAVSALPNDPTAFSRNRFVVGDTVVAVDSVVDSPKLAVLSGMLSIAECDALIAESRALMAPSLVIDEHNVDNTVHDTRTSSGMHFVPGTSAVADAVQRKIMAVIGLPIDRAEPLQVLRYGPGEEYVAHFDFFDAHDDVAADAPPTTLSLYGQRVATMICYLSAVESGGATVFPEIGFEVRPLPGRAVYFTYVGADGTLDPMSLHGGAPVHEGEKWIVTQWCRERPYRASGAGVWAPPVSPAAEGESVD
jgi:prolyl 4-hydroxylase